MAENKRKVVLVGAGLVGTSFAYAALNQGLCDELVLIDIDKKRAQGEAMDLNHGMAFAVERMKIFAGDYPDCADADVVVICAGVSQKPGESRLELLKRNARVFETIVGPVKASGFEGILLVATNPVDIMTYAAWKLSGFPAERVFGTGTTLDTARLRYLLGEFFAVDPRNIHGYVLGEHGDSEFVPWSQATFATKSVLDICAQSAGRFDRTEMLGIESAVRDAAQQIIVAKKATYYGIGMALVRIIRAILGDENSVLTVSALLRGEYGEAGVFAGIPCVIGRDGVKETVELRLTENERERLARSCALLRDCCESLGV